MTVENEIKIARLEKRLNEEVDAIMAQLNIPDELDEAAKLNLRYSELGNELMEADYSSLYEELAKNGVSTIEEAFCVSYIEPKINPEKLLEGDKSYRYAAVKMLREAVEEAAKKQDYKELLKTKIGEKFTKAYNKGGKDLDSYINANAKRYIKKGMDEKSAKEKATSNYEKLAGSRTEKGLMKNND